MVFSCRALKKKLLSLEGQGDLDKFLKKIQKILSFHFFFLKKNQLNILQISTIKKYLKYLKPDYLIHLAGLSRPMKIHEQDIIQSIDKNIIGTANITKVCSELNIKLIYISTCYVYPGIKGNYNEDSPLLPINNYAWSKLGGECSVQLYKNSLILRASVTEKPFIHKKAFADFKTNFIFHDDLISIIIKLLDCKGIINIGGKSQSVYKFAKKYNSKIKKISAKNVLGKNARLNVSMDLNKLKKTIND